MAKKKEEPKLEPKVTKENCKHCKGTGKHMGSVHPCTFCHGL